MQLTSRMNALRDYRQRALKSLEDFGSMLGVNKSTVLRWERKKIPAERVLDIERATGVPRHELRPDIYPPPETERAAS